EGKARRCRTILRVDSGAGSVKEINWALARGYLYPGKDYSSRRAERLAASVAEWVDDPKGGGRQIGYVAEEATDYVRPVVRIAVRCPKAQGGYAVAVLVSALAPSEVLDAARLGEAVRAHPHAALLAYVHFYDERG